MTMPREMKDSGIEWIGEIPRHWSIYRLKDIFTESVAGEIIDKGYWHTGTELLYTCQKTPMMSDYPNFPDRKRTGENDLLLTRNATPYIFIPKTNSIYSNVVQKITLNNNSDRRFVQYVLQQGADKVVVNGDTIPSYNMGVWSNIKITFPPVFEQNTIADYLDTKCAEIDAAIEQTKTTIEEYKKLKQSVITEAVTKGIRGDRPMKDSGIEWIGEIPSEWKLIQIKHLKSTDKNAFVDGPFGSNLKSIHFVENGDVYVVESGFITTGKFVFKKFKTITASHFETIQRSECKAKDIIIAKIGANFGMAAELPKLDKPSVVSGNSLKITLNQEKLLNSIFVYELGIAKNRGGYVGLYNETAQPALSLSSLNSFKLVVAPMEEQKEIADYLDKKCAEIDTLIEKKTTLLAEMESFKKSLIYDYVTGKKQVIS